MKPAGATRLRIVPTTFREACEFVDHEHRHHKRPYRVKFQLAVADEDGRIRGVAMVGRPKSRHLDNGHTVEVVRVATDGHPNACSALYGACWRAARAMGFTRMLTYTLPDEGGASLRAAGARLESTNAGGGKWSRAGRKRADDHPLGKKWRWAWRS